GGFVEIGTDQSDRLQATLGMVLGMAVVEIDGPGMMALVVDRGIPGPSAAESAVAAPVGEINAVHGAAGREGRTEVDEALEFVERRQAPVAASAKRQAIDVGDVGLGIAVHRPAARRPGAGGVARIATVVLVVGVIPVARPHVVSR